jgi:type IV secretion system protein VirD4
MTVEQARPQHPAKALARQPDPAPVLWFGLNSNDHRHRLPVGVTSEDWTFTDPATSTLWLGPPRSKAGKTASGLIPSALAHPGPAVIVSSKLDIATETALARCRLGTVWHFNPSGEPTLPGFKELRWSPLIGAEDWDTAQATGRQLVTVSNLAEQGMGTSDIGHHFDNLAAMFIACLFHYAALKGYEMRWVIRVISAQRWTEDFATIGKDLERLSPMAGAELRGLVIADPRHRGSVAATASNALRAYKREASLKSSEEPNIDLRAFVRGKPQEPNYGLASSREDRPPAGQYDTIYITAGSKDQEAVAGIICCFLSAIRDARYELHRRDSMRGNPSARLSTLLVLDELANITPWHELANVLSEGGSQGLLTVGAIQDLSQARQRFGVELGKGWLTLWQNKIILPGIMDKDTLDLLSELAGEFDRETWTQNYDWDSSGKDPNRSWSRSHDRRRRVPIDMIYSGHPQSPDLALVFLHGGKWQWLYMTPYYRSPPWAHCLVRTVKWAARVARETSMLPLPNLNADGQGTHLARLYLWHDWQIETARLNERQAVQRERSADERATWIFCAGATNGALFKHLIAIFEDGGNRVMFTDAPFVLPGEMSPRQAFYLEAGPERPWLLVDATQWWERRHGADSYPHIPEALGEPVSLVAYVRWQEEAEDWLHRLILALKDRWPTTWLMENK